MNVPSPKTIIYVVFTARDGKMTYFSTKEGARVFAWNELMMYWIQENTHAEDIIDAWNELLMNDEITDVVHISTETLIDSMDISLNMVIQP